MLAWVATAVSAQTDLPYPAKTLNSMSGELEYVSELGKYQPYADQPVQSWREANDQVGRIGAGAPTPRRPLRTVLLRRLRPPAPHWLQ